MRRSLSSPLTLCHKLLYFALVVGGVAFLILAPRSNFRHRDGTLISVREQGLGLLLWAIGMAPGLWYSQRLMRVQTDGQLLYVSNYRSEIAIPLTDVNDVSEGRLWYYVNATVTIHLRRPSRFGQSILFVPRPRLYWRGEHPAVLELRALCERAKVQER
jgi:hypothetical protein